MNMPACISGAADWVLKLERERRRPSRRRPSPMPMTHEQREQQAVDARASGRRARSRR